MPLLTDFQKTLCNRLQTGLPICHRPFQKIAKELESNEPQVLQQTKQLKDAGIIRRIGPFINYRCLGFVSTLSAAHIEQERLPEVVDAVNRLSGVSHNFLRHHYFNLWFTLRVMTEKEIETILADLSSRFKVDFCSLPAVRVFKLDVCFDAESDCQRLLENVEQKIVTEPITVTEIEKEILARLQDGLQITEQPFDFLCKSGLDIDNVLNAVRSLLDKGVIRRFGAAVDHKKIGFAADALFACKVEPERTDKIGSSLAALPIVSHCYQRRPCRNFNYNLFAMLHSKNKKILNSFKNAFVKEYAITDYQLMTTIKRLKTG